MKYYYFKFKNAPTCSKYIGYLGTIKQLSDKLNMSEYQIKEMYKEGINDYYEHRIIESSEISKDIKDILKNNIIMISNDEYIEEVN